MNRNYKVDNAYKNLALAEGTSANIIGTNDPQLWRGPRLLVPVELDVLVVDKSNEHDTWANVLFNPNNIAGYTEEKQRFEGESSDSDSDSATTDLENQEQQIVGGRIPFNTYESRQRGIYLHWSLPDGLTHGKTVSNELQETPPEESSSIQAEQQDLEVNENTEFPLVPDRWLVTRFSPGKNTNSKRQVRAWIIKSEEPNKADRIVHLGDFREDRSNKNDRWLTAIGEGDPGYAAYYDNVEGKLGFYDDMSGVDHGPISYLISGWYSDKQDDPLYEPKSKEQWKDKLQQMGWALSSDAEDADARLATLEKNRKRRAYLAGIAAKYSDTTQPKTYDYVVNVNDRDYAARPPYTAYTNNAIKAAAADKSKTDKAKSNQTLFDRGLLNITNPSQSPVVDFNNIKSAEKIAYLSENIDHLAELSEHIFVAEDSDYLSYWPRQMLCHSMTYGVKWNNKGGQYDPQDSGKPTPENLSVSVGNTGVEALSALLAKNADQANAERIYNGYHYGLLPELQQQDGLATLESLLHSEDFKSQPGGFVTDSIMEGDAFPNLSSSEANAIERNTVDNFRGREQKKAAKKGNNRANSKVKSRFYVRKDDVTVTKENMRQKANPYLYKRKAKMRKSVAIRKAMPRYWQPKDPVILFSEAERSYKHGEDSRFSEDGLLICRLSEETVSSIGVNIGQQVERKKGVNKHNTLYTVLPSHMATSRLQSGQIPPETHALFNEALLLDLDNASIASQHILGLQSSGALKTQYPSQQHKLDTLTTESITQRYQVQASLLKNLNINPELDAQALASVVTIKGRQPNEFAQKPWRKPWTPLHMDWQVEWIPNENHREDWHLDEHDYETTTENDRSTDERTRYTYQGSTLLTPAVTRSMADRLTQFIEDEALAESGSADDIANEAQERVLGELREAIEKLDVLSGSLSGFHDYLLAQVDDYQFSPLVDAQGIKADEKGLDQLEQEKRTINRLKTFPVRAGHFKLTKLRVVDAFGQYIDVPDSILSNPIKAEDMESSPSSPHMMRLPPRIVQPSRLMFRMVQAENDQQDASKTVSPICGWILPDHLDEALEIYDDQGHSVGQVQRRRPMSGDIVTTSLEWQGVPGDPGSFGAPPSLGNKHLQGMVNGLLAAGEHDAKRALNPEENDKNYSNDTALGAMLRMIDSTLWTVDPLGREGNEHLSVLVGRPLAIVRASLRLETKQLETQGDLSSTAFDVRLGELTRLGDGLIGYFINDDYSQFYPIHEEIANQTRPSRPHHGYLGAIQTTQAFYSSYSDTSTIEPVKHPYINETPTIKVRPVAPGKSDPASKSVMLTLVVDPRGGVHATSGILPRKKIELLREHVATALENMSVTFRIGPVLSNPETIRMPLPSEIQGNWSWVRKTGLTVWEESPVVNAVPEPKLSHTPSQIQEGWLKLSNAQTEKE